MTEEDCTVQRPNHRSDCTNHCTTGRSDPRISPMAPVVTMNRELSPPAVEMAGEWMRYLDPRTGGSRNGMASSISCSRRSPVPDHRSAIAPQIAFGAHAGLLRAGRTGAWLASGHRKVPGAAAATREADLGPRWGLGSVSLPSGDLGVASEPELRIVLTAL